MSTSAERMRRLRERRKAEIEPGEPVVRDAAELLAPAVARTVEALGLGDQDDAAARLAHCLALAIDRADKPASALRWIGPELLKVLEALGATPMARARMTPKKQEPHAPSQLDRLRSVSARQPR
jgi:hypothetical protein